MSNQNVDEYLQQGIHGPKQIKPDERRKYLGTLRERVVVAMTQSEVYRKGLEPQLKTLLSENKEAHLYLNGNIDYSALSKYIKAAGNAGVAYTIVTNKEYDSEYGLVLAYEYAIDKEDITLSKKSRPELPKAQAGEKSLFSKVKTLFGRK
ncbi:YueI family protein [Mesobacillus foraminis]|uniref:YueI family protein n=1 Tax=Mesobacillus foraminis TaxID=279826 RepID=UPI000EF45977|nr:YueI family protein [Mesobacillus foraminis]